MQAVESFLQVNIQDVDVVPFCALLKDLSEDKDMAPVVQRVDNAIHRINRYPADKC